MKRSHNKKISIHNSKRSRSYSKSRKKSEDHEKKKTRHRHYDKAKLNSMTLDQLHSIAKSHGIAFGGISKSFLIDKILHYQSI
jgi:ribosomal protein L9